MSGLRAPLFVANPPRFFERCGRDRIRVSIAPTAIRGRSARLRLVARRARVLVARPRWQWDGIRPPWEVVRR
ncbi:hypothetical protein ACWEKT_14695 [Nocardia takedensis]